MNRLEDLQNWIISDLRKIHICVRAARSNLVSCETVEGFETGGAETRHSDEARVEIPQRYGENLRRIFGF